MSTWIWLIIVGGILILVSFVKMMMDIAILNKKYRPENLTEDFFRDLPNEDRLQNLPHWEKMEDRDYRIAFYKRVRAAERADYTRVKQIAMIRIGGGAIMGILGIVGVICW